MKNNRKEIKLFFFLICITILFSGFIIGCGDDEDKSFIGAHVVKTTPSSDAENVVLRPIISAVFSEDIDVNSLNKPDHFIFYVREGKYEGNHLAGEIKYDSGTRTASFKLAGDLADNLLFEAKIKMDVLNLEGKRMKDDKFWSFKTLSVTPTVEFLTPGPDATDVELDAVIIIEFSEEIAKDTVKKESFSLLELSSGGVGESNHSVEFTIAPNLLDKDDNLTNKFSLTPTQDLNPDKKYRVYLTEMVTDITNTAIEPIRWHFETVAAP